MRKRTKVALVVVAMLLLFSVIAVWNGRRIVLAYLEYRVAAVTTSLPECDRVEAYYLAGAGERDANAGFPTSSGLSQILDHKTLTGADATSLAQLWRSQAFGYDYQMLCHGPVYGLRFYDGSTQLCETSVCFHCYNFDVWILGVPNTWGFDTQTPEAAQLLSRLQQVFPESIPDPNPKFDEAKAAADEEGQPNAG